MTGVTPDRDPQVAGHTEPNPTPQADGDSTPPSLPPGAPAGGGPEDDQAAIQAVFWVPEPLADTVAWGLGLVMEQIGHHAQRLGLPQPNASILIQPINAAERERQEAVWAETVGAYIERADAAPEEPGT
jgi:hypothetical protein